MKKLIYSVLTLGLILSLSSFSSNKKNKISVNELDSNSNLVLNFEASSFSEFDNKEHTSDKTTWTKRHKTWTDFSKFKVNSTLENIINRN